MDFELASSRLKALGHPTRLRICYLLRDYHSCVKELELALGLKQPNISQHLRILKDLGLVQVARKGQTCRYSKNKELLGPLLEHWKRRHPADDTPVSQSV